MRTWINYDDKLSRIFGTSELILHLGLWFIKEKSLIDITLGNILDWTSLCDFRICFTGKYHKSLKYRNWGLDWFVYILWKEMFMNSKSNKNLDKLRKN